MPARSKRSLRLPARVPLADLTAWLNQCSSIPREAAPALAGLLAFYGLRIEERPVDDRLQAALIEYLEATQNRVPPASAHELRFFPDEIDRAEVLLQCLQNRLGHTWPVKLLGPGRRLSVQREDGTARLGGRGLTDYGLLMTLGTLIVRRSTQSDVAARGVWVRLLSTLKYPFDVRARSLAPTISTTRKAIEELYREHDPEGELDAGRGELSPRTVREVYLDVAEQLGREHLVALPRRLGAIEPR